MANILPDKCGVEYRHVSITINGISSIHANARRGMVHVVINTLISLQKDRKKHLIGDT